MSLSARRLSRVASHRCSCGARALYHRPRGGSRHTVITRCASAAGGPSAIASARPKRDSAARPRRREGARGSSARCRARPRRPCVTDGGCRAARDSRPPPVLSSRTSMKSFLASLAIGVAAGTFGGLVGLGGGIVMIPLMVRFAGLRQQQAHGTSLVALVFTGIGGAATYAQRGARWTSPRRALLAVTAIVDGPARRPLRPRPARVEAEALLRGVPRWPSPRSCSPSPISPRASPPGRPGSPRPPCCSSPARFTGFLSGMMGVGGGRLMVPAMVLLAGFPQVLAQGSSLLAMVPAGARRRLHPLAARQRRPAPPPRAHPGDPARHLPRQQPRAAARGRDAPVRLRGRARLTRRALPPRAKAAPAPAAAGI